MTNTGCRIVAGFARVERALIEQLARFPVANIGDCLNRLAAVDSAIRPLNKAKLAGSAFTIRVPEGDNLMFHKAMDMAEPGDVFVIDAGGHLNRAICGSLMMRYCAARGVAGVIVDGAVRDLDDLSQMTMPVYARGVSPNGPYKNGPGEINTPVVVGGKLVNPGDIVLGDADGIVIVSPDTVADVIAQAAAVFEKELQIVRNIDASTSWPRPWVDAQLKALECQMS